MFQLGTLAVLCSLLTGTSASYMEIIQKLTLDVEVEFTQESERLKKRFEVKIQPPKISLDNNRFNFSLFINNKRMRLDVFIIPDLQSGLSSNSNGREMKMSLVVDASVHKPNDNLRDNTTIALERHCSVRLETESQNSLPDVTMWKCSNETMKDISDSSGRQNARINSVIDIESSSMTQRVLPPMEKQMLEMSDAVLKTLTQAIISDTLMEENQSPSEEEGAEGGMS